MAKQKLGQYLAPPLYFAWRQKTRVYGSTTLMGYEAYVVNVDVRGDVITVVTHNLFRVETLQLDGDDFYKLFVPDLLTTPYKMAELLSQMGSMCVIMPESAQHLKAVLTAPFDVYSIEDYTVGKPRQQSLQATIHYDVQRRTCIETGRSGGVVSFIPVSADGIVVEELPEAAFDKTYKPIKDYPTEKAARLFVEFAVRVGASHDAMNLLNKLATVTPEEIEMATSKLKTVKKDEPKVEAKLDKKVKATKSGTVTPETVAKAAKQARSSKKVSEEPSKSELEVRGRKDPKAAEKARKKLGNLTGKYGSAAAMFKALIMAGKMTDTEIFKAVQAEFDLPDSKRGYVVWYRNSLRKQGDNPPEPKTK